MFIFNVPLLQTIQIYPVSPIFHDHFSSHVDSFDLALNNDLKKYAMIFIKLLLMNHFIMGENLFSTQCVVRS